MENCGYEMLFETARFWASRVNYNKRKKKYEINHVIGPDEFHRDVNNNAYTNMLAKWNLICAYKLFSDFKKKRSLYKKLKEKLNLKEKEVKNWKNIAANIRININKKKVIEQFDGYFKLKKVTLSRADENGIPLIPAKLKPRMLGKTQLVKQADVIMLLGLLNDIFSLKTKFANYNFYIPRTVHKSSLSPAIHSILACEVGDLNKAYNFFKASLHTDISNAYGNTNEGIHAAALGGTWQAVVFGFGGVRIRKEKMMINPRLPRRWNKLIFSLFWKEKLISFELTDDTIKLKVHSRKKKAIELGIFNKMMPIEINKTYTFKRSAIEAKREEFY
jgi:kojibiose phosphorylase